MLNLFSQKKQSWIEIVFLLVQENQNLEDAEKTMFSNFVLMLR